MPGDNIQKYINHAKKTHKIKKCHKNLTTMKYNPTDDFKKLKPKQYTLATKSTYLETKVKGKREIGKKVNPGDFVFCGPKKELYALSPESVKKNYMLNSITTKKIKKQCVYVEKDNVQKLYNKNSIDFIPSWGGNELMHANPGDVIVLEKNGGYRIERSVFNKTYKIGKMRL